MKEIFEFIINIEKKYSLLDWKIGNVFIWQAVRHLVHAKLVELTSNLHSNKNIIEKKPFIVLNNKVNRFLYSFKNSCIKGEKEYDSIVFEFVRKVKFSGLLIDIFTDDLVSKLREDGESVQVIETPDKKYTKRRNVYPIGIYSFRAIFYGIFSLLKIRKKDFYLINEINKEIFYKFGIDINFKKIIVKNIFNFIRREHEFNYLIEKRNPKKVYMVAKEPLSVISVCKKRGVRVIELQHGAISPYHIAYSFPNNSIVEYFPDYIYVWGEYWKKSANFPIDINKLNIYGNKHLLRKMDVKKLKASNKNIVIFSQWNLYVEILSFVIKLAKKLPEYNFLFKLHPKNSGKKNQIITEIKKLEIKNIHILGEGINIQRLMVLSGFQIGVYSTAILEGLYLGCKTIILDLPGCEYMEFWIRNKFVIKASTEDEVVNIIRGIFKSFTIKINRNLIFSNKREI